MRLYIQIVLIGCLLNACAPKKTIQDYRIDHLSEQVLNPPDTLETILGKMLVSDLKDKSSAFLRYSRNQYFARKGYIFKDANLALFFNHQPWYQEATHQIPVLDSAAARHVPLLQTMENTHDSMEYMRTIHQHIFNGVPLYYIAWDPHDDSYWPDEFSGGGFFMLDTTMLWILDCKTIPPEYIQDKRKSFVGIMDEARYIQDSVIRFKNIDQGCRGGEFQEMEISLEGPIDDYQNVIVGLNRKGEIAVLFKEYVAIGEIHKLNDSTL